MPELTITRLGFTGDGIAEHEGQLWFTPFTLPGERVEATPTKKVGKNQQAELTAILAPSALRQKPPCAHFTTCGGCVAQHMDEATYRSWKQGLISSAFGQNNLPEIPLRPLITTPPGARRRIALTALHDKGKLRLGYHAKASHTLIDINDCSIASPQLIALLPALRQTLGPWVKKAKKLGLLLTTCENGIDVLVTGPEPDFFIRESLVALAQHPLLARLSWRQSELSPSEPLLGLREPLVTFGNTLVSPPPGAFLQPSLEGQRALTQTILEALAPFKPKSVVDLFAGCGTFTFPLVTLGKAHGVEGDKAAHQALLAGTKATPHTSAEQRDLFRMPLTADELNRFDAVVIDPPRIGAVSQTSEIAASKVPTVVAVSCNPATFARDALLLMDGGYTCEWVQPIDQFLWSPHIELVALFRR